jgi:hypothetical protein
MDLSSDGLGRGLPRRGDVAQDRHDAKVVKKVPAAIERASGVVSVKSEPAEAL